MIWDKDLDKDSSAYKFASNNSKIIRVVAGPGTGKSFGLQHRVARLLEQGVNPHKILAVTFTRTAAQDLKKEIHSIGVEGADKVVAKTLHSFCFGLLNKRNIIKNTGRYPRPVLDFERKPMLYDMNNEFGKFAEKEKRLKAFEAAWARLQSDNPGFALNEMDKKFEQDIKLWLKDHKAMLFGEMIIETFHYLRNNPMCLESQEFEHILVDEYQDLNKAEQAVIGLLAANCSLAVIGDDDQSIYSFKYAHPEGIRNFYVTHPGCESIDFDKCRRCPKKVVAMASRLIQHNTNRTLGDLQVFEKNQEGNVEIIQWPSLEDEIEGISARVSEDINDKKIRPEDVLILVPVSKIGFKIRDSLVQKGINAKSYSKDSVLGTDNLKYNMELLTVLTNPNDLVALRYLLGFKNQTFCTKSYRKLLNFARVNRMSTYEILEKCVAGELKVPGISTMIGKYQKVIEQIKHMQAAVANDSMALLDILAKDIPENKDFRKILKEALVESEDLYDSNKDSWLEKIHAFVIDRVSFPEDTSESDHVRIMSMCASLGLSAKYVIIMSAIDDLIPRLSQDSDVDKDKQIEEQRRLFYVAITRCKSSNSGYPGTLIISSFVSLPGNEALNLRIPTRSAYGVKCVSASRFIRDFGETAPCTIAKKRH